MFSNDIIRDSHYIQRLKEEICRQYGISAVKIEPAKRGYYGETWKIATSDTAYFLKSDYLPFHQERFRQGLCTVEYLCSHGIDFAGKLIKTLNGQLYSEFDGAFMGLFEWVDGNNLETDDTKVPEYQMLCKIYQLPTSELKIPSAVFSDCAAVKFFELWNALKGEPQTTANSNVLSTFKYFEKEINQCALRLTKFAEYCRKDNSQFYLTHGDAGGNFFVGNGKNYIFDWDEAIYAPIERDAWVMGCYEWARNLFNNTLKENNINYKLRSERLAFYCYHMYFFYLGEFLMVHPISDKSQRIKEYLEDGWIKRRISFAETIEI